MPKVAKSASPKGAPSPKVRSRRASARKPAKRSAWPKSGGARILTREEVMATMERIKPGQVSAHEFFYNSPLRKFNLWLIKNGREPLGELDVSLREGSDV